MLPNTHAVLFVLIRLTIKTFASLHHPATQNANHVFNAIHSSLRQWGSSLNHNGMSFFLATVPADTQLYHGTYHSDVVEGMEWLAFEPEHALVFARPRQPRPPPGHGYGLSKPEDEEQEGFSKHTRGWATSWLELPNLNQRSTPKLPYQSRSRDVQQPIHFHKSDQEPETGYLHTYVPTHPLHLLYIDGLSAGKTSNGTLDTQDKLLLNLTEGHGPMGGEYERATGMCNMSNSLWQGNIDGILRMEGGFEIILCDFEKHLERISVVAVPNDVKRRGPKGLLGNWPYIKAITARYNGIGSERVILDQDNFVSVFAYPDATGLFDNDVESDYIMPRLQNVNTFALLRIRDDITKMISRKDWDTKKPSRNWQALADLVVQRYSRSLHYLHTNENVRKDSDALATYLTPVLRPFIDTNARNTSLEIRRCVAQFIPPLLASERHNTSLAHTTLYEVTRQICDTLLSTLSIISSPTSLSSSISENMSRVVKLVDDLIQYLQWTTWRQCGPCADEEVCWIPIWPMGNHEDHANPQCRSEAEAREREAGYWGFR